MSSIPHFYPSLYCVNDTCNVIYFKLELLITTCFLHKLSKCSFKHAILFTTYGNSTLHVCRSSSHRIKLKNLRQWKNSWVTMVMAFRRAGNVYQSNMVFDSGRFCQTKLFHSNTSRRIHQNCSLLTHYSCAQVLQGWQTSYKNVQVFQGFSFLLKAPQNIKSNTTKRAHFFTLRRKFCNFCILFQYLYYYACETVY